MERRAIKSWSGLAVVGILIVFLGMPIIANAQGPTDYFPIVRCGTADNPEPCTPCGLFEAGDRVIRFILFGITGPIAAFMLVVAGGMYLVGADNPGLRNRAKSLLTRTILGVTIILLSWTATNFLIKLLGTSADQGPWYEYSCPAFLEDIGKTTPTPPSAASQGSPQQPSAQLIQAIKDSCTPSALAAQYKTPSTIKQSPDLVSLRQCLEGDAVVSALIRKDGGRPFTYDQDNNLCNYTHGIRTVCTTKCSHSQYSCHYGGKTGVNGAEAADYTWNGKRITYVVDSRTVVSSCPDNTRCRTVGSWQDLFDELYRASHNKDDTLKCKYKLLNYEGNHVHVSTQACDSDGTGVSGATVPGL